MILFFRQEGIKPLNKFICSACSHQPYANQSKYEEKRQITHQDHKVPQTIASKNLNQFALMGDQGWYSVCHQDPCKQDRCDCYPYFDVSEFIDSSHK
jgi:hypothetical protein